jgi:hypothetical protein
VVLVQELEEWCILPETMLELEDGLDNVLELVEEPRKQVVEHMRNTRHPDRVVQLVGACQGSAESPLVHRASVGADADDLPLQMVRRLELVYEEVQFPMALLDGLDLLERQHVKRDPYKPDMALRPSFLQQIYISEIVNRLQIILVCTSHHPLLEFSQLFRTSEKIFSNFFKQCSQKSFHQRDSFTGYCHGD